MTTTNTCVHVWRLPSPDDPVNVVDGWSVDRCRNCGAVQQHMHRFVVPEWHRQAAAKTARAEAMSKRGKFYVSDGVTLEPFNRDEEENRRNTRDERRSGRRAKRAAK